MTHRALRKSMQRTAASVTPAHRFTRAETGAIQRALLRWFAVARRPLPWRSRRDPYSTWVSEVMLQQTQVSTVVPYFERWMRTYPTVSALANSREQDVLKLWEGLGYYSRARSLLAGARVMCEKFAGQVPSDLAVLRSIPGIGRYTAGAIASIGHGKPAAILDGNVMRVLCRVRDLEGDPRKGPLSELLWGLAEQLVTDTDPSQLNESLMELGALVCTPTKPKCTECPLRSRCKAFANQTVSLRPTVIQRVAPTEHRVLIAIVSRTGRFLVQQQPEGASRWAGLWTFPHWQCADFDDPEKTLAQWLARELAIPQSPLQARKRLATTSTPAMSAKRCQPVRAARSAARNERTPEPAPDTDPGPNTPDVVLRGKYTITRFRFSFVAVQALVPRATQVHATKLPDGYSWVTRQQLLELPMPAPHRRVALAIP